MNPFPIEAVYSKGLGKAHEVMENNRRQGNISGCLGAKFTGTFNCLGSRRKWYISHRDMPGRNGYWYRYGNIIPVKYHLCELVHSNGVSFMAWALDWRGVCEKKAGEEKIGIELMSRDLIPDCFKDEKPFTLNVLAPWSKSEVDAWWPKALRKWFQSFVWGPIRADGESVWGRMYKWVNWSGARVLDVGCNTGWYSFQAAKYGAHCYAYDTCEHFVDVAKTIAKHIEYNDVQFGTKDPGGNFDAIFYLSVHHYVDPTYEHLTDTLLKYKARCKTLFVEVIAPPPDRPDMTLKEVKEKIRRVCGDPTLLLYYKHPVRCMRMVWKFTGDIK